MRHTPRYFALLLFVFLWSSTTTYLYAQSGPGNGPSDPVLSVLGSFETGIFDEGAAEIAAFDELNRQVFFVNAGANQVVILSIADPQNPTEVRTIELDAFGGGANSVAVANGLVAVAVEAENAQDNGVVVFFDAATGDRVGSPIEVGALPDAVAFTPNGRKLIVANEGEPSDDYSVDPVGSVTIIDLLLGVDRAEVTHLFFDSFNGMEDKLRARGVRIFGPGATVAQDLEPENIATSPGGRRAFITLQENNAIAVIDGIHGPNPFISEIIGLGFKDHSQNGNALDVSDEDGLNIRTVDNLLGMYQPDAIASFDNNMGNVYIVTANEGDGREYDAFEEEVDVADIVLDPAAFPNPEGLGELTVTNTLGTTDRDVLTAELEGDQEVPPPGQPSPEDIEAEGRSALRLNQSGPRALEYSITIEGLDFGLYLDGTPRTSSPDDDVTRLHLHAGAPGENGPIVLNVIENSQIADQDDEVEVAENEDGTVTITGRWEAREGFPVDLKKRIKFIEVGNELDYYWNVHTTQFPAGAIRGQLVKTQEYDKLYAFGARSFSLWTTDGDLLFDSGDEFERITAEQLPDDFNSNNDENGSFDSRSDNKGPEPEAIAVGDFDGRQYVFIGLERVGGVMVYDASNPYQPMFVQYLNNRNFDAELPDELADAGDLGPESIVYVPPGQAGLGGNALLVVSNEVSGTVTFYQFGSDAGAPEPPSRPEAFTLQLLHTTDLEAGGLDATENAPRFSALVDLFRSEYPEQTLLLSSGDNYLPGPFFAAGGADALVGGDPIVQELVGDPSPGRADIALMNAIGFDGSALGNHEFDQGPDRIETLIAEDDPYPGTSFPYLSVNLDFTGSLLEGLVVPGGQAPQGNSITPSVVYEIDGQQIGVVGATTPALQTVSSPGPNIGINPPDEDDIAALAEIIQAEVNRLIDAGVNKIILVSHLQEFNIDLELVQLLEHVDIAIAGGSDRLLADDEDRQRGLRPGDDPPAEDVYPLVLTDAEGEDILVVSTDGQYNYLARLVVEFDQFGEVILSSVDENVSGAFATDEAGLMALGDPDPIEGAAAIAEAVRDVLLEKLAVTFGVTEVFLNGTREEVRTEETNFGNLTADANLIYAQAFDANVQVSLKNGGGIRAPIGEVDPETGVRIPPTAEGPRGEGEVAQLDIETALSFNNSLALLTLTPEQLLAALENGVSNVENIAGRFPQVAGLEFSFDPSQPVDSRVQTVALVDGDGNKQVIIEGGSVLASAPSGIRVVTLGFLAAGNDGYTVFTEGTDLVNLTDVGLAADLLPDSGDSVEGIGDPGREQDALAEYFAANFVVTPFAEADTPPENDQRIQNLEFRSDTVGEADMESSLTLAVANFQAVQQDGAVVLQWDGSALAGLEVEQRAPDAVSFARVGAVNSSSAKSGTASYRVTDLEPGVHTFRLKRATTGGVQYSQDLEVDVRMIEPYSLSEVYPNPFRGQATMDLMVREAQDVRVEVFNVIGQRVATVFDGRVAPSESVKLSLRSDQMPSGSYFYRIQGETFSTTRRAVVVR